MKQPDKHPPAHAGGSPRSDWKSHSCEYSVRATRFPEMIAVAPARCDNFAPRVEIDRVFALSVQIAEERALPATEGEESHRRRYAQVDPEHSCLNSLAKNPRRAPARAIQAGRIPERAGVHALDRFVEAFHTQDGDDRAEDFLAGDR